LWMAVVIPPYEVLESASGHDPAAARRRRRADFRSTGWWEAQLVGPELARSADGHPVCSF
jgi:hypothetical protein